MQALIDGLVDLRGWHLEHGPQPGGHGRGEVGDVVDLVLVQANARYQRHLHLIGREYAQGQRAAVGTCLLGGGEQAGDVVAGMRVVGREVGVVHVEFAHGNPVGEGGPLAVEATVVGHAKEAGTAVAGMGVAEGEEAGVAHRRAVDCGEGDCGVVDDAIANHLGDICVERLVVGGELGQLPSQLLFAREDGTVWVGLDDVVLHDLLP